MENENVEHESEFEVCICESESETSGSEDLQKAIGAAALLVIGAGAAIWAGKRISEKIKAQMMAHKVESEFFSEESEE